MLRLIIGGISGFCVGVFIMALLRYPESVAIAIAFGGGVAVGFIWAMSYLFHD